MRRGSTSVRLRGWVAAIAITGACVLPAAAETIVPSPSWQLTVRGGRMTARVQDAPLETVLREISRRVPMTVSIQGAVARELVSVQFRDLPVEEGIRKVLQGREYAIIHRTPPFAGAGGQEQAGPREVIVFSGPGSETSGADAWMSVGDGTGPPRVPAPGRGGGGPKPGTLMGELEEMGELEQMGELADEDELLPVVAQALEDRDPRVREKAMEVLEESLGPIPVRQLAHIAESERDPLMRSRALTLLAFRAEESAGPSLTRALQDPDAEVRALASDLLTHLGLAPPSRASSRKERP